MQRSLYRFLLRVRNFRGISENCKTKFHDRYRSVLLPVISQQCTVHSTIKHTLILEINYQCVKLMIKADFKFHPLKSIVIKEMRNPSKLHEKLHHAMSKKNSLFQLFLIYADIYVNSWSLDTTNLEKYK